MEFELHYHVSNGGDGSASVHFHQSKQAATKADEDMEEGWGEPCNGSVKLKVEDGKLFFREFERVNGKYEYVWKPIG